MTDIKFIPKDIADKIKETAQVFEVVKEHVNLNRKNIGKCPYCNGKKFEVNEKKGIYKCWTGCAKTGNSAVKFLTDVKEIPYVEAMVMLSKMYSIEIIQEEQKKPVKASKTPFRNRQLRDSGIPIRTQKWWLYHGDENGTRTEMYRYESATIDEHWKKRPGDDMILHYLDLQGKPIQYFDQKKKAHNLIRVRWANPEKHKNKKGQIAKYKSPYKSGSHLWLPNRVIAAYKTKTRFNTLIICEGEKKADKLSLHDNFAVGIMGIHNFSLSGDMPYILEQLIRTCNIKNVLFLLDSDWQDISIKDPNRPVDSRPNTFFKAVSKFRDYFRSYSKEGINLDIFFGWGKDPVHKGIDDVMVMQLKKSEGELAKDIDNALIDREGKGHYIDVKKINSISDYKLMEEWDLTNKENFFDRHHLKLRQLHQFKYKNLEWVWDENEHDFVLNNPILPHERYWTEIPDGENAMGNPKYKYKFHYGGLYSFLKSRGFGLYELPNDQFRYVRSDGKVLTEITPHKVQRFVQDFTREIDNKPVLEMIYRGGKQYLGPDKLSNMFYCRPEFNESDKNTKYLYFKNVYWKITKDGIQQRPIAELPRHIWKDKIIDFEPKYVGEMCKVTRNDNEWKLKLSEEAKRCEMTQFYANTSNFHWKKQYFLNEIDEGKKEWQPKQNPEPITAEDKAELANNLAVKMIAAGYVLHDYLDYGAMKAVVCMDGIESEVGKSQGGTGKSIWAKQFSHLVPTEIIDGKKKNIEEDNHLYENVDERTEVILFDDIRVNFNFEFLFSQITTGVVVNPKGQKRTKLPPRKFILTTNHALNGEGNSFSRRQYVISFSDYYNGFRNVGDEFGHQLFYEWEFEQWNLFYNWMATCIQTYLQYGLEYSLPKDALQRRKLRQQIGENFIDWAFILYSDDGVFLNRKVEKKLALQMYLDEYPKDRNYVNARRFKDLIIKYAAYTGLDYNKPADGKRIKSGSSEYFILSNDKFDATKHLTINSKDDLNKKDTPY